MATLEQIRFSIIEQARGNIVTDDTRLRYGFIDHLVREKRALLLEQQRKRGMGVQLGFYQTINCLSIACGQVECAGYKSGVDQLYIDLPAGVQQPIAFLGSVDGSTSFQYEPFMTFSMNPPGLFGRSKPRFTILENKALLRNVPTGITLLQLVAVLYDPLEKSCATLTARDEYPVPIGLLHQLELLCLRQLLSTSPIQPDVTSNASDDQQPARVDQRGLQ